MILTGAGRGFCAGVDLRGYGAAPGNDGSDEPRDRLANQEHMSTLVLGLRALPQPVIAAVNGPAAGFGLALDARLRHPLRRAPRRCSAPPSSTSALSNCDMGTSWLLPRLIGASRSHELMLTGRRVDAEEALRIGLVADVVEQDALLARALEAAEQIAALAPWGVRLTKRGMWTALEIPSEQAAVEYEDRQQIMATFGSGAARGGRRVPREAPGRVRRLTMAMSDLFDVSGKTALVTGGSRGIGLMIARGLVQAGARVIISSRKSADIEAAAEELGGARRLRRDPGDISTPEGAQALAAATRERFPSLDILVNNAGAVWGAPLEEFPPAGWEKVMQHERRGRLPPDGRAAARAARGRRAPRTRRA